MFKQILLAVIWVVGMDTIMDIMVGIEVELQIIIIITITIIAVHIGGFLVL
jgi:hypothetical protein